MEQDWINIEGENLSFKDTPQLLRDLDLIPIFLRRFLERKYTSNVQVDREEQISFQQQFLQREKISNKDSLNKWLNSNNITEFEMNKKLYNSIRLEKFKKQILGSKIEPLFLKRKSELDRVTYSLIRVKTRAKAAELHMRLQEKESTFPELSATYSEGIEQVLHGLIGPIEIGKVNPFIAERLKTSSPGQLWAPFEIEGWWVIIRLERLLPSSLNNVMRERLINEMYEIWITDKIINIVSQLENTELNQEEKKEKNEEEKNRFFKFFEKRT
ncbi:peptidylprolyl isomerase [Prochlorococcus marinus]|uniref:peptidylprolyl isomerase n=1 Tax=Prochlorococcus marinus TaxID=1219 RepID=UPI0022B35009|nr:peptidylprolyl isomerase [Prochlorococcus marinus]